MIIETEHTVEIFPWNMSATKQWGQDTGLPQLQSYAQGVVTDPEDGVVTVKDMVDWLGEEDPQIQLSAMDELIRHGHPRQAVEFLQALVKTKPECETPLRSALEPKAPGVMDLYLKSPLDRFPGNPQEFPKHGIKASFVQ